MASRDDSDTPQQKAERATNSSPVDKVCWIKEMLYVRPYPSTNTIHRTKQTPDWSFCKYIQGFFNRGLNRYPTQIMYLLYIPGEIHVCLTNRWRLPWNTLECSWKRLSWKQRLEPKRHPQPHGPRPHQTSSKSGWGHKFNERQMYNCTHFDSFLLLLKTTLLLTAAQGKQDKRKLIHR